LQGVEKARVGARLALVHLLAQEYDAAIAALDESKVNPLPDSLASQRRHLRARAMMGLLHTDDALALLADDKSKEAEMLRMEIFWNDQDWPKAAKSLKVLTKMAGVKARKPLDEKQARLVLNLAVAMTLSGNERGIARMRADYGAAMAATTDRDAFKLIASSDTLGLISYASIAGRVAEANNFQSFIAAYQERLKAQKLSAIN